MGTGLNFPYYTVAESVGATEPDPFMLRRARKQARDLGLTIEFRQCAEEALPLPDAAFDTVVSTLTLCTVGEPARAMAEVRRASSGPAGSFVSSSTSGVWVVSSGGCRIC